MTIGKVHLTEGYARFRVRNPHAFQPGSMRTIDPGRPGHTKLVIGRLKGQKTTATQAVLVGRRDYERGYAPSSAELGHIARLKSRTYRPSPSQLRRIKRL